MESIINPPLLTIFIVSYIVVSVIGVLLHYTHQIFKTGILVHIFSAINESTWEHTKLSFYPMLGAMLVHSRIIFYEHFWSLSFIVLFLSIALIPLFYYLTRKILGKDITAVNISIYFIVVLICFVVEYYFIKNDVTLFNNILGIVGIIIISILYVWFTYFPPKNEIFRDPVHKKFGEFKQPFDK